MKLKSVHHQKQLDGLVFSLFFIHGIFIGFSWKTT